MKAEAKNNTIKQDVATYDPAVFLSRSPTNILKHSQGFTLIEIMIVSAIIGILAAIAIPAYNAYISTAKTNAQRLNFDTAVKLVKSELIKRAGGGTATIDIVTELNSTGKKSPYDGNVATFAGGTSAHTVSIVLNPTNLSTVSGTVTIYRPTTYQSGIELVSISIPTQ